MDMKHPYLKDLQAQLLGSVTDNPDALAHFSTDQSIFQATPEAVVYPQNTADVRKVVQFAAERALDKKPLALIPRGKGSDLSGGAVGEGMHVVFPAHMNKLLRLERDTITVQPGIIFQTMQQTLYTHGRFVAQIPAGAHYSTLGGLVASDSGGEKSIKYGNIRRAVKKLKVVLSDGSLIETGRISARELTRKKGLLTLEGEIYMAFNTLLTDNEDLIKSRQFKDVPNTSGYDLWDVTGKSGSFDLTPLFIGSQGTLGLITEITLTTLPYNPRSTLVVGFFDNIAHATEAVTHLKGLGPSAIEMVDKPLLENYLDQRPGDLDDLVPPALPKLTLLVEFDNYSEIAQKLRSSRAARILRRHGGSVRVSADPVEQVALWKIRRAPVAAWLEEGQHKALPFMEDASVPVEKLSRLIDKTYKLLKKHDLKPALWGHAGTGSLRLNPQLDLAKKKDIDTLFALATEYSELVASLGGTLASSHGDGLLRSLSLKSQYGEDFVGLLTETKNIFDPHNILNPAQKTGATEEYSRAHLRPSYGARHLHDFIVYT